MNNNKIKNCFEHLMETSYTLGKDYMSLQETAKYFQEWVTQFSNFGEFLFTLFNAITGRVNPKKVGLSFFGPPNTGKTTWIEKCLGSLFETDQIQIDGNFTWSKLPENNAIVLKEFCINDDIVEMVKDLMDNKKERSVAVKSKPKQTFNHSILWLLCHNEDPLSILDPTNRKSMEERITLYQIKKSESGACPGVQEMLSNGLKPNPMIFQEFIINMNGHLNEDDDIDIDDFPVLAEQWFKEAIDQLQFM